jgi:hypothetical protein
MPVGVGGVDEILLYGDESFDELDRIYSSVNAPDFRDSIEKAMADTTGMDESPVAVGGYIPSKGKNVLS